MHVPMYLSVLTLVLRHLEHIPPHNARAAGGGRSTIGTSASARTSGSAHHLSRLTVEQPRDSDPLYM